MSSSWLRKISPSSRSLKNRSSLYTLTLRFEFSYFRDLPMRDNPDSATTVAKLDNEALVHLGERGRLDDLGRQRVAECFRRKLAGRGWRAWVHLDRGERFGALHHDHLEG